MTKAIFLDHNDSSVKIAPTALAMDAVALYTKTLAVSDSLAYNLTSTQISNLVTSYLESSGDGKLVVGNATYYLYDKESTYAQPLVVGEEIHVTPQEFTAYQEQISREGMATMSFRKLVADKQLAETFAAVLLRVGKQQAWLPKSVIYGYNDSNPKAIQLYVKSSFPITWTPADE